MSLSQLTIKPLTTQQIIAKQINDHFLKQDSPPANRLIVPKDSIYHEDDKPLTFNAIVVYETNYCSKKTHVVHVQFDVDKNFVVKRDTIHYV